MTDFQLIKLSVIAFSLCVSLQASAKLVDGANSAPSAEVGSSSKNEVDANGISDMLCVLRFQNSIASAATKEALFQNCRRNPVKFFGPDVKNEEKSKDLLRKAWATLTTEEKNGSLGTAVRNVFKKLNENVNLTTAEASTAGTTK